MTHPFEAHTQPPPQVEAGPEPASGPPSYGEPASARVASQADGAPPADAMDAQASVACAEGTAETTPQHRTRYGTVPPGEALKVTITRDRMEAYAICDANVCIEDPDLAFAEMMSCLRAQRLVDIREDMVRRFVQEAPLAGSHLVAQGRAAQPGEDARIVLNIAQEPDVEEIMASMERVDYRSMHQIDNVEEGEVLATLQPAMAGTPGFTVTGVPLPAKHGRKAVLLAGKNVDLSADGLEARARCRGVARMAGKRLTVEKVYTVKGNVDLVVGNIEFVGDVQVGGDVLPDFHIKAEGSIHVRGDVDKAALEAEQDIRIRGGLFGKPEAVIKAGGDVHLHFAENAHIQANNDVFASDALMQCDVRAGNRIVLLNHGPCCVGGRLVASGGIEVMNLGAPKAEVKTIAQIQSDPRLNRMRQRWLADLEEEKLTEDAQGRPRKPDPRKIALLEAKIATIDRRIEKQRRACIAVRGSVYRGVEIIMGDLRYLPSAELTRVKFILSAKDHKILLSDF